MHQIIQEYLSALIPTKYSAMQKVINFIFFFLAMIPYSQGQWASLEIDGHLSIGNTTEGLPKAGTIQWNGDDLEGFNGYEWVTLTGGSTIPVTDITGNTYQTIRIGDQIWMAENLRTNKYANGALIPNVTNDAQWDGLTSGAWCWFENNNSNEIPLGKLYNWYAVENQDDLCPIGWRLPTDTDMQILIAYLGGSDLAGGKLKEEGTEYWIDPNVGATNESSFSARPHGGRGYQGKFSTFFGYFTQFWTISEEDQNKAWYLSLSHLNDNTILTNTQKKYGMAVRCIKQ